MALDSDSFLPDAEDCAETWRQMRWDEGLYCPVCGSDQVQTRQRNYRDHLHRYYCETCGKWFIDTTGTFLEASNVSLQRWVYFAREMHKGRASGPSGEEIDVTKKTARRMAKTIRPALYAQREGGSRSWPEKLKQMMCLLEADSKGAR